MDDSKTTPPDAPAASPDGASAGAGPSRPRATSRLAAIRRGPTTTPAPPTSPAPATSRAPTAIPLFDEPPRTYRDPYGPDEPYGRPPPPRPGGLDFSALFVLIDALRRAAPAELQDRMTAFIREGLLTLRSLIDWYLDKLDRPKAEPKVEDIPID